MAEDLKVIAGAAKLIPIEWLPTFGAVNLVLMALLAILVGTYKSLQVVKKSKDKDSQRPEVLTPKSAAMFPVSLYEKIFLGFCAIIYVLTYPHTWIADNMMAIFFSIKAIEEPCLENVFTGSILQRGLLIYAIFWVFATVADIQNLPIKIVFPVDIFDNGLAANKFMMLGLGDIIFPALFISLLFRFDNHLNRKSQTYFITGVIAYILGLWVTFYVATTYDCAQPALLYLVPACKWAPLLVAWLKGDIEALFQYSDFPSENKNTEKQINEEREKTE